MKKGIVFTVDVILAMIIATASIVAIMYYVSTPQLDTDKRLYLHGCDVLAVADLTGDLGDALGGDDTGLTALLESTDENVCINLEVFNSTGDEVLDKATCGAPTDYVQCKRSIVDDGDYYTGRARVWYR